jgi:hypothetical protein
LKCSSLTPFVRRYSEFPRGTEIRRLKERRQSIYSLGTVDELKQKKKGLSKSS